MNGEHPHRGPAARLALACGLAAAVLASAIRGPAPPVHADSAPITWNHQIAPLVYAHCTSCHHAGGSGPFDLTSYAAARRWGLQMADVVASRYMPPWLPAPMPGPVHFSGDRRLKAEQIELLTAWVKAGMPEGEGAPPPPPTYTPGWELGEPDLVLEMPAAMTVPASGQDLFENFILPAGLKTTRWIRAMEIQPGSAQLTHHANVILDRAGSLRAAHPADWQKGIPGMDLEVDGGDAFDPDSHFLFWKPDSTALVEPAGMPWRLDPGDDLVLNMHLKPTGKPETVRARIGLYFAHEPATEHPMLLQLEDDGKLDIPAGDRNFVVQDALTLPVPVEVLGVYPHAHYLCHHMEGWAELPGGSRVTLVDIPDWDIDRQSVYRLEKPLKLPAGTTLHMRFTYDNSVANVHNPNSPPVRVRAGNRSADEMGHLWLQVLPLQKAQETKGIDPRLALDRAWMESVLRKNPADAIALYNLAALEATAGQPQKAAALFQTLLNHRPDDVRARTSLGSALEASGDTNGAQREFQTALHEKPGYPDAAFDLAMLKLGAGDAAGAETLLRPLVNAGASAGTEDVGALDGLGSALLAEGRNGEAEALFAHALAVAPGDRKALLGSGQAKLAAGDALGAEKVLGQALFERDDAEVRRLLAMSYASQGETPRAEEQLQAWLKLAPDDPEPHRALAQVFSGAGENEKAIAAQREAVRLAGKGADRAIEANDWNDLGAMQARAGQAAAAREAFEHALWLDPANTAAKGNLQRLASR